MQEGKLKAQPRHRVLILKEMQKEMMKRRYPPGERKNRIAKLLEYVVSNPGCRRLNIQAHMNSLFRTTLSTQTISEYLRDMVSCKAVKEENGQFFITKNGELMIERFTHEK